MKKRDYENLTKNLYSAICAELGAFVETDANAGVYAVALDANEDSGGVLLCINTEKAIQETINTKYPQAEQDQIAGLSGIRFNPAEFSFSKILDLGEPQEKYIQLMASDQSEKSAKKHCEMFSDALAEALRQAEPTFIILQKSEGFIAYHAFHDSDSQKMEHLFRKTISQELFEKTFPEIAEFRSLVSGFENFKKGDQVRIWISLLRSYVTERPNRYSGIFFDSHGYYDIEEYLVKLQSNAIGAMVDYLEEIVHLPSFNEIGSTEWETEGAISRSASASCTLLFALKRMRKMPDEIEPRLNSMLMRLRNESKFVEGAVTICLLNVARAIHAIWPKRYPQPIEDDSNNRLLNYLKYIGDE